MVDLEAWSLRAAFGLLAAVAMIFLVAPTLIVLLTSFTATESLKFPPDGFSFRWYVALLDADQMQRAAWNSLIVAIWTTVICVVLGTMASIAIARSSAPGYAPATCCSCRRCCCRRSRSDSRR